MKKLFLISILSILFSFKRNSENGNFIFYSNFEHKNIIIYVNNVSCTYEADNVRLVSALKIGGFVCTMLCDVVISH